MLFLAFAVHWRSWRGPRPAWLCGSFSGWLKPGSQSLTHTIPAARARRESRLCSPRHAGGCYKRYEGTTSAGNDGWGLSCASRAAKARSDFSGRRALTYLGVAWRAEHRGKPGSQRRRPNARCAAVGEAREASRDADVAVAHAHAQRYGCLSSRWAQTCAPRAKGTALPKIGVTKVRNRTISLNQFIRSLGGAIRCGAVRFHRRGIYAHAAPHSLGSISRASTPLRALRTQKQPIQTQ